jgi:hypothetical protein
MSLWKYRAFDASFSVTEGIISGPDEIQVLLRLRQQGLQGIDIRLATRIEYLQERRLQRLKNRLQPQVPHETPVHTPNRSHWSIRSLLASLCKLFRR